MHTVTHAIRFSRASAVQQALLCWQERDMLFCMFDAVTRVSDKTSAGAFFSATLDYQSSLVSLFAATE